VQEKYPIGSRIKGVVRNFTNYGAFVELEPGIDGMIHVSDMSWTRKVNHPSEVLKKGDEVECVILEVDAQQQRISLGLKQAHDDPWSSIAAKYKVGQIVKGKVSKLASFGAFVEIEEGIDGLVHISQISDDRVQKVKDALQPGTGCRGPRDQDRCGGTPHRSEHQGRQAADDEFVVDESMLEGLRPGEDLVDLAGAFDEAMGQSAAPSEEWHPGQKKDPGNPS
jgi:small subunit ribosomal protein S1